MFGQSPRYLPYGQRPRYQRSAIPGSRQEIPFDERVTQPPTTRDRIKQQGLDRAAKRTLLVVGGTAVAGYILYKLFSGQETEAEGQVLERMTLEPEITDGGTAAQAADPLVEFEAALPHATARRYARLMYTIADEYDLDPYLIAGIMEAESNYGLGLCTKDSREFGSGPGPAGYGCVDKADRGLMQININANPLTNWAAPETNIRKAASIIQSNEKYFRQNRRGKTVTMPKKPNHSRIREKLGLGDGGQVYPDPRPLSATSLLRATIAAYNAGAGAVLWALAAGKNPDLVTYSGRYSADIIQRINRMRAHASLPSV